jgi:predicted small lipoprotein YifL
MKNLLTLVSVAVVLVFSLAGCGPKTASTPNNSSTSSSKSSSSASASAKNCAAGYTAATINGQAKCLQPGQECQQAQASSYKQYGFTCTKVNNRYVLQKK